MPPLADLRIAANADPLSKIGRRDRAGLLQVGIEIHPRTVAQATDTRNSFSYRPEKYSSGMDWEQTQTHRRKRLQAAVDRLGGKATLGRKLGYSDGSYVGQMLRKERIISEETVAQLESLDGMSGWFGPKPTPDVWPFPLVKQDRWERLTEQEKGFVQASVNRAIAECETHVAGPNVVPLAGNARSGTSLTKAPWRKRKDVKKKPGVR